MTVIITMKCGQRASIAKHIRKHETFLDEAKASDGILQLCSLGGTARGLDVALVSCERKTRLSDDYRFLCWNMLFQNAAHRSVFGAAEHRNSYYFATAEM